MKIDKYFKPQNIDEAYKLLNSEKNSALIGGGAFIRLSSKSINTAIDLSNTGLNFINEREKTIEIGAMTTLRQIEINNILNKYFNGILPKSVSSILGVQMRNLVTVGGTIYGKYSFSDFITALLALNCHVVLHNEGKISLKEFIYRKGFKKDILEKIIIKKDNLKASFQSIRNTSTDFAILNAAVSKKDNEFKIVVGARPGIALFAHEAMEYLNALNYLRNQKLIKNGEGDKIKNSLKMAEEAGMIASEGVIFGSNFRGSAEYRKEMCKVLVKRGVMEVVE